MQNSGICRKQNIQVYARASVCARIGSKANVCLRLFIWPLIHLNRPHLHIRAKRVGTVSDFDENRAPHPFLPNNRRALFALSNANSKTLRNSHFVRPLVVNNEVV